MVKHRPNAAEIFIAAAVALAGFITPTMGTTRNYTGADNGDWGVAGNWTPSGIPGATATEDIVLGNVTMAGVTNLHVNITGSESTVNSLNSLTLNSRGIGGFMIVNQSGANTFISVGTENIGLAISDNTYNLTGGRNDANFLNIGGSSVANSYNISGAAILNVFTVMTVGVSGAGTMNQSGGNVTVGGSTATSLVLGANTGSAGTYNLSSGNLTVITMAVGKTGSGTFNQTGGLVFFSSFAGMTVSSSNGTATYNFSGGTLDTSGSAISIGTNGTFNLQTGGTFDTLAAINSGGTFNIAGGLFSSSATIDVEGGVLQVQGTSDTLTKFYGGSGIIRNGATSGTLVLNVAPYFAGGNPFPFQFMGIMKDGASGTFALTLTGGEIGLTGANTYSGPTSLGGVLHAQSAVALSPNSNITLLANGTLDVQAFSVTVPSLAGTAGTLNIVAGGNISIGTNNASTTFSGVTTGSGGLTKVGSGTLTLNGGGSFTGAVSIQAGTLAVNAVNGIPVGSNVGFSGIGGTFAVNANQSLAGFNAGLLNSTIFSNNATLTVGSGNIDGTHGANFSGAGTFLKTGSGNYTLGYGSSDNIPNADSALSIGVNAGTLILSKTAGVDAMAGPISITGGSLQLNDSNQINNASVVTLGGGSFNLNGFNETIGGLAGAAGNVTLNGGTLTVAPAVNGTYAGGLVGPGTLIKTGPANLTISNSAGYNGAFTASAGRLILQGAPSASSFTANANGTLQFNSAALNIPGTQIQANANGTVEYLGATISNAFLRGAGTHVILSGATSTFNGVTTFNSTTITQTGTANFNNFTNGGTVNNNAALAFNGGVNSSSGIINVNNVLATQDFTNSGVINIGVGASVSNSGSNLFLAGGSRTYIGTSASHGGTLTLAAGTTLEVNGALLVNDGTISGTTNVNYGGTAEGVGSYGPVNVTFGGIFQPGFASSVVVANGATVTALSGSGTIDNTSTGAMALTLLGNSASTFSGPIQNSNGSTSLAIQGASSLTLLTSTLANGTQSANTFSGGLSIASGASVVIGASGALPVASKVTNDGTFAVNANSTAGIISGLGTLTLGANAKLTLASNSGGTKQGALVLGAGAELSINNNELVIEATNAITKSTYISQLAAEVATGQNGGLQNGPGIVSAGLAPNLKIAVIDNAALVTPFATFGGQTTDSNSILLAPELLGDTNIDGHVDLTDLNTVLNHLGAVSGAWTDGNFDGASTIDLTDLNDVLNNLGVSYAGNSTVLAAEALLQASPSSVPEPASLLLLATGVLFHARRRQARS